MIENISLWAKNITLSVIMVSLFEMLLPNKKIKLYVNVVMGLYILFNIISPFVGKNISINLDKIIEDSQTQATATETVDQTSMDKRLKEIGEEELKKDITKKVENLGFIVENCEVKLVIQEETKIEKIVLQIEKKEENTQEREETNAENKLVEEIQKIKEVQVGTKKEKKAKENENITTTDINQIKKMLMQEYEVSEKCLKIN